MGVLGNENAEAAVGAWLARAAVSNSQVLQTPTARGELNAKIRRDTCSKWKEKCKFTNASSNRYWERELARLRIGHSRPTLDI